MSAPDAAMLGWATEGFHTSNQVSTNTQNPPTTTQSSWLLLVLVVFVVEEVEGVKEEVVWPCYPVYLNSFILVSYSNWRSSHHFSYTSIQIWF